MVVRRRLRRSLGGHDPKGWFATHDSPARPGRHLHADDTGPPDTPRLADADRTRIKGMLPRQGV